MPIQRVHHETRKPERKALTPAPRSKAAERVIRDEGRESFQVVNYNVAGGNNDHAPNFRDRTSNEVADRFVDHGADVATLQEVGVNNKQNPGQDYNREILTDIFADEHNVDREDVQQYYLDENNERVRITEDNAEEALDAQHFVVTGGGHEMTIDLESLDSQGNPQEFVRPGNRVNGDPHGATVYRAQLENGDEYNVVFGDSGSGDKGYGNSVVLGPDASIRDANGTIRPGSVQVQELGQDPELWKPESERERRSAVGVRFTTSEGQSGTAFSAHLTTESLSDEKAESLELSDAQIEDYRDRLPGEVQAEQQRQAQALNQFAETFGGNRNVIIGADFNHDDPQLDGFHVVSQNGIDGIWGTSDINGRDSAHYGFDGEASDHDMQVTRVYI